MRISQEEWNKRLEEVKLASQDCKTISEIIEITDYNRNSIKTLFKKFPEEAKEIKDNLSKNKEETVKKKKRRKPNNKKRLTKILEASKSCKNLAELSRETGFSYFIIKNTLSKFPEEEKKVRENLEKNKKRKDYKDNKSGNTNMFINKSISKSIIMIDTSFCRTIEKFNILEQLVQQQNRLAISDLALTELVGLKKGRGFLGKNARDLINIIKENLSFFEYYRISEKRRVNETIDQAIIEACIPVKNIILLTADKEMYIQATLQGVNSLCLLDEVDRQDYKFHIENK